MCRRSTRQIIRMKLRTADLALLGAPALAAVFICLYAPSTPSSDEWLLLRNAMILQRADSFAAALQAMSFRIYDHPILVPALVYLPVAELFHYDSRASIALTWLALLLILIVFRLYVTRSAASCFPVAVILFSPACYVQLLWGFQFTLGFSVAFPVAGLAVLSEVRGPVLRHAGRLVAGFGLILLGILSSAGAAFALPAAAVLFFASGGLPRRDRVVLVAVSLAAFLVTVALFASATGKPLVPGRQAMFVLMSFGATIISSPTAFRSFGFNPWSALGLLVAVPALAAVVLAIARRQIAAIALPLSFFVFGAGAMAAIALARDYLANWHLQYALPAVCGAYGLAYLLPKRDLVSVLPLALVASALSLATVGYAMVFLVHRPGYSTYSDAVENYVVNYLSAPDAVKPHPPTGGWEFDADMARFLIEKHHPRMRSD